MSKNIKYQYFVEGENEKTMFQAIKTTHLFSRQISVFNILEKNINSRIRLIEENTCVILVFDTDVLDQSKVKMLESNLQKLKKEKRIKSIILIPQISNFEDELIYSTSIKKAMDFTDSISASDFKRDFNKLRPEQILQKLQHCSFDIQKFWSRDFVSENFSVENNAGQIKIIS